MSKEERENARELSNSTRKLCCTRLRGGDGRSTLGGSEQQRAVEPAHYEQAPHAQVGTDKIRSRRLGSDRGNVCGRASVIFRISLLHLAK